MLSRHIGFVTFFLGLSACGGDDQVTQGAGLYVDHCRICHGADLRGGGGAGVVGLGKSPSDLTLLAFNAGGTFPRADVLMVLDDYAAGKQVGRTMRPFAHLSSEKQKRVKTEDGRKRVPRPQAALLAYLEVSQIP